MKENFSKRVQSIMRYAKEEAIRLGHSYVGSEHLLLGIIKQETGVSHKLFEIYNCDVNGMRSMIEDLIIAAVNQALQNAGKAAEEKMSSLTGGLAGKIKMPGMV